MIPWRRPFGSWSSSDTSQSRIVKVASGEHYWIDWGDGTIENRTGTGADETVTHTYVAGTYTQKWTFPNPSKLQKFDFRYDNLSGPHPNLEKYTSLETYYASWNDGLTGELTFPGGGNLLVDYSVSHSDGAVGGIPDPSGLLALKYITVTVEHDEFDGEMPSFAACTNLEQITTYNSPVTGDLPSFAACTKLTYIDCSRCAMSGSIPSFAACTELAFVYLQQNDWWSGDGFSGNLPSFAANTKLDQCYIEDGVITGAIPSFDGLSSLTQLSFSRQNFTSFPELGDVALLTDLSVDSNLNLTGSFPSLEGAPDLEDCDASFCAFTGTIPSLSSNTSLVYFDVTDNQFTGYTASTLSLFIESFLAGGNSLSQAAVDQVLADFETNITSRPSWCLIYLNGGSNSPPSAAGLASIAAIMAARPSWQIFVNS